MSMLMSELFMIVLSRMPKNMSLCALPNMSENALVNVEMCL